MNSRLTLSFPILVMSLILRARVKILCGLQIMQREDLISEQTIFRSKAHIPGPSVGVSKILRDEEVAEEGNTNEDINRYTSIPEDTAQPSSQAQARAPDRLDHLIGRVEELYMILASHINYSTTQFTYLEGKITALSSQVDDLMRKLEPKSDLESNAF